MPLKPVSLDHVNIYVRNAARSHEWYTDILGLHTQDIFYHPGTERMRAAFLACDRDHAHDIALFEVGDEAALPQKGQVGLNHVAWRMANLDDLAEMWNRERPFSEQGEKGRFPGPWDEALRQPAPPVART